MMRAHFLILSLSVAGALAFSQEGSLQPAATSLFTPEVTNRYTLHFPSDREDPPLTLVFTVAEPADAVAVSTLLGKVKQPINWDPASKTFLFASLRFHNGELDFAADGFANDSTTTVSGILQIHSGYDLKDEGPGQIFPDGHAERSAFFGLLGIDNGQLVPIIFPGLHDKSAFISTRTQLGERVWLDLGGRYEQPAQSDEDHLLPRVRLVVLLNGKTRLIAGYGRYAEFTGVGNVRPASLEDGPRVDLSAFDGFGALNFANGGLDSVFRNTYLDFVSLGLERDLTHKTSLRMEGYQASKNAGLSFNLKTKF